MSDLDQRPTATVCGGRDDVTARPVRELLAANQLPLGESTMVRRLLPNLSLARMPASSSPTP